MNPGKRVWRYEGMRVSRQGMRVDPYKTCFLGLSKAGIPSYPHPFIPSSKGRLICSKTHE